MPIEIAYFLFMVGRLKLAGIQLAIAVTKVSVDYGDGNTNSTREGCNLNEWDQKDWFATHHALGTRNTDRSWATLDRTGSLTTTTLDNHMLLRASSWLDYHGCNHNGSNRINLRNLTANNVRLTGIHELNGPYNMQFGGNGAIACNGMQSTGRFRGITLAGITSAGTATVSIGGNFAYSGGHFVLHYGCHTTKGQSNLSLAGNTSFAFASSTDRFHHIGLSAQSRTANNCKLSRNTGEKVSISGYNCGTFMSSASRGLEGDTIMGKLRISFGNKGINCVQRKYSTRETLKFQKETLGTSALKIDSAGPDPFQDESKLNILTHSTSKIKVQTSPLSGETEYEGTSDPIDGMNEFEYISGSTLRAGTYVLPMIQGRYDSI